MRKQVSAQPATALEEHLQRQAEQSREFFWNRLRWGLIFEHLPKSGADELVDVGAGPGFLGDALTAHRPNFKYRFIEPLESLEKANTERFGADSNLREATSFGDAAYVTLLDVLEHQEDDRQFMRILSEKMNPGALLLLTVPAMPSLWSEWDTALGHFRRYRKSSLDDAVKGLPFEIEEMSYLFPELLPMGYLRKLKLRFGPATSDTESSAEFPDLPPFLNESLYRVGRVSMRRRSMWGAGTSLFAALRRTA